jgi:hypothetical protein
MRFDLIDAAHVTPDAAFQSRPQMILALAFTSRFWPFIPAT